MAELRENHKEDAMAQVRAEPPWNISQGGRKGAGKSGAAMNYLATHKKIKNISQPLFSCLNPIIGPLFLVWDRPAPFTSVFTCWSV